jgi:hypothetical protein
MRSVITAMSLFAVTMVAIHAPVGAAAPRASDAAERPLPAAFGPGTYPPESAFQDSRSFTRADRIVGTYFFYWYDIDSNTHIINSDGSDALTTHPAKMKEFSYKSTAWHKQIARHGRRGN